MKKIAILVIASINNPVYIHYINTFWTQIINYTNKYKPNIDIFLLFDENLDISNFKHLQKNIIVDKNTNYNGCFNDIKPNNFIPGILSKTIYAYEILQDKYDIFFRTNLSSVINIKKFEEISEGTDIIYSGGFVWHDALRENLIYYNKIGPNQSIKSLQELENYKGNTFVSGCGYFLNSHEVKNLIKNKEKIRYDIIDDVSIGLMMENYKILSNFSILIKPSESIEEILNKIHKNKFAHIRLQHFPLDKAKLLWLELEKLKIWI